MDQQAQASPLLVARLWRRLAAFAIDAGLLWATGLLVGLALRTQLARLGPWGLVVGLVIAVLYLGACSGELTGGQTLGKRLLRIRVTDAHGDPLPTWRGLLRALLLALPWFAAGVKWWPRSPLGVALLALAAFLAAGVGPAIAFHLLTSWRVRQGLHDRAVGSYVIRDHCASTRSGLPSASPALLVLAGLWLALTTAGISATILFLPRLAPVRAALALGAELSRIDEVHAAAVVADAGRRQGGTGLSSLRATLWTTAPASRVDRTIAEAGRVVLLAAAEPDELDLISIAVRRGWDIGLASSFDETVENVSPRRWREKLGMERKLRLTPVTEIAPAAAPPSTAADEPAKPLAVVVGPEGRDEAGYPLQYVDRAALRRMLKRGQYPALTDALERLQREFEEDPRKEEWPDDAAIALGTGEPELLAALDAWVAVSPDSFAPYLARGAHWVQGAYRRRGGRWAHLTTKDDLRDMEEALQHASADLERAVALRPRLVVAMRLQLQANLLLPGAHKKNSAVIARALGVCRSCFQVRVSYLHTLKPRWGGSYPAMRAFIRKHPDDLNPRLRLLPGFIDLDQALAAASDEDYAGELAAAERACALGERWNFLEARGRAKTHLNQIEQALTDLDRALALRPAEPSILYNRAWAKVMARRWEAAGGDLRAALQLDPMDYRARNTHAAVVKGLIREGYDRVAAGRREEGIRLYDLAAELDPNNGEIQQRREEAIRAGAATAVAATSDAAAAGPAPDDFQAVRQLDYALASRGEYEKVVSLWNDFLARHPDHGPAYLERGGAQHHLRRFPEALADARKACDLGLSEACARAKQVEAQMTQRRR